MSARRTGWPDFLVIGAAKSATTWLQRALQAGPHVAMPDPELHYFSREHERGDDWYLDQFPTRGPGIRAVGEKSNSYLDDPQAAARIAQSLPDVRLVAQMRDPVARAYSDYCMLFRRGEVGRDIEAHLDPRRAADGRFIALGRYAEQLERHHDLFPADRMLHGTFEAATAQPLQTLAAVHLFLDLPPAQPEQLPGRVKSKRDAMVGPTLRRRLKPLKPLVAPLRGTRLFEAARGTIAGPIPYPPLPDDLRERLADHYARHNERLAAMTGLDLSVWTRPADTSSVPPVALAPERRPQAH